MADTTTPSPTVAVTKPPFLIPQVAGGIAWLETFVVTVSSLLLAFVAVTTVASAIHGGNLLADTGWLSQAYAWSQGIGIEGQLSGMAFEAMKAARTRQGMQAVFFWCVTLVLAGAAFMAVVIVNYQQSFGVSFADALAFVGISKQVWVLVRAGVLIGLIVLAAAMRYSPPAAPVDVAQKLKDIADRQKIAEAEAQARAEAMRNRAALMRQSWQALRTDAPAADPVVSPEVAAQQAEMQRLEQESARLEALMRDAAANGNGNGAHPFP